MKEFKNLRKLKKELEELESIYRDYLCVPTEYVADTVKDYTQGVPRTMVISGYGNPKYAKVRQTLSDKKKKLTEQIEEIETALEQIEDSEQKTIYRLYYVEGLTQQEIADRMHYNLRTIQRRMGEDGRDNKYNNVE